MTVPSYFGRNLREARMNAGLTLRQLADKVGVTHVFIGEVERGVKARITEKHWDGLMKALSVKKKDLEEWSSRSEKLELDLREQSEHDHALTFALARAIRQKVEISDSDRQKILKILGQGIDNGK